MDGSDSFDIGEFERENFFATSTAWERMASRPRETRTYGRHGNNAIGLRGRTTKKSNADFDRSRDTSSSSSPESEGTNVPAEDEDTEKDTDVEDQLFSPMTSPENMNFVREYSITTPPTRRRKTFVRSKTISDVPTINSGPSRPPRITRSQSVSTFIPERSFSSYSRSVSMRTSSSVSLAAVGGGDCENFNPNFSTSPNVDQDYTSPKRFADAEVDQKGRKKSKCTSHPFLCNDDISVLKHRNGGDKNKMPASATDSFSNLARSHGEFAPTWATSSMGNLPSNYNNTKEARFRRRSSTDETMEGTGSVSSSSMSLNSSTRKRGVYKSQFLFDESPVSRSRSRISSPLPVRTPDISSIMGAAPDLMDVSFCSKKNSAKADRMMLELDVTMSDDDINNVSGESDISVDSEDDTMTMDHLNLQNIEGPLSTKSTRVFDLEKATVDDIAKYMPSYEDMQFLLTSLQQNFKGQGGCLSWNVAPPVSWPTKRRDTFFQATRKLGFTFRAGGGNVSFIQISKTRGCVLLSLLETTLVTYDERKLKKKTPKAETTNAPMCFTFSSTVKKKLKCMSRVSKSRVSKMLRLTPKELTLNSRFQKLKEKTADELTQTMSRLNMNAKTPATKTGNSEECCFLNVDDNHSRNGIPRDSLEYHSNSLDLNAQLHGATPVPPRGRRRPLRLSLQSLSSRTTTSTSMDMQSPFVSNSNSLQPAHINTHMNYGISNCEFVSTPLVGRQSDWGSRPFNDRDWGASEPCAAEIIEKLFESFSQLRKRAGFYEEGSDQILSCNDSESSCLGLDFESVSQYADEIVSPGSSSLTGPFGINGTIVSRTSVHFSEVNAYSSERANELFPNRDVRRRQTAFAKHRRMSLFASAINPAETFSKNRKSLFVRQPRAFPLDKQALLSESAPEFFSQYTSVINESASESPDDREASPLDSEKILRRIFDFLGDKELFLIASLVSTKWSDVATQSHANLMLSSIANCEEESLDCNGNGNVGGSNRSWKYLTTTFPWACFLSEGAFKRVYKVFNRSCQAEEAISVMDVKQIHSTGNINVVGAELAVSVMLSSLVRRGICPNFVVTRGMFSCRYEPPDNYWGNADNKMPRGEVYSSPKSKRRPREPKKGGRFQYIRMELCGEGDAEEFMKCKPGESVTPHQARNLLFQISFALYAAAEKFSLKHYDVKLLNVFLQRLSPKNEGDLILRYGLGEHTFALQLPREDAIIAKLADYGTANVNCESNGQNVTIAQFTTLENTPPDFLILGDEAIQGHGHDCFGLGLCMLHLFTGHAPYEEILEGVCCPFNLRKELRRIWENEEETQYSVVRSIVLADVYKDEDGHVIEGEPDETLYDTLYKFLVLFGIPDDSSGVLDSKVMAAVKATLVSEGRQKKVRGRSRKVPCDANKFASDRSKFSLSHGSNQYVSRARMSLSAMEGGMDLLLSLVHFNPQNRASALDVLNSSFMAPLREIPNENQGYNYGNDEVLSFTAFSTQKINHS